MEKGTMLKETPISEIIKELNLPKNTEFLGYVLRIPEKDEFLASYCTSSETIECIWAKTPGMAKIFGSFKKASKAKKHIENKNAIVGWLFDMGDQYYVTSLKEHLG